MTQRRTKNILDLVKLYGPAFLLTLAAFAVAFQFVDPAPPDYLVLAAGPPEGAYSRYAERYRENLARQGIRLEVLHTSGSIENLRLLDEGNADVAFVQAGTESDAAREGIMGLGSLYFEPAWLFVRNEKAPKFLTGLEGLRVAIGTPGSGTRSLAKLLLRQNELALEAIEAVDLGGSEAAEAMLSGEVDAALFVSGVDSPLIAELIASPDIGLMSFRRAAAYARLFPFLSEVVLPEGVIDMHANLPGQDVHLVTTVATLAARDEIHPALVDLLMQALKSVHGGEGWFEAKGRFPSPDDLVLPINPAAERFYEHGPPFLQRYLPFWAATLVDRLKVMLLPLLVILLPLIKLMPPIYQWRMRARILRWYKALEDVESRARQGLDTAGKQAALTDLDRIEGEARQLHVPLSFAAQAYDLRLHVRLVRETVMEGDPP